MALAVTEALQTSCDQPRRAGDGRTIIIIIMIIYEISQLYRLCRARSGSPQLHFRCPFAVTVCTHTNMGGGRGL